MRFGLGLSSVLTMGDDVGDLDVFTDFDVRCADLDLELGELFDDRGRHPPSADNYCTCILRLGLVVFSGVLICSRYDERRLSTPTPSVITHGWFPGDVPWTKKRQTNPIRLRGRVQRPTCPPIG